jgi:hypothetical protein
MWLMTPRGFYSAVEKRGDREQGMVTIRARVKGDLESLLELLPDETGKPYKERFGTDYPWRIRIPAGQWAHACARMALEIDYANFKDEVARKQGKKRAGVYGRIWGVLLDLERRAQSRGQASFGGWDSDWRNRA